MATRRSSSSRRPSAPACGALRRSLRPHERDRRAVRSLVQGVPDNSGRGDNMTTWRRRAERHIIWQLGGWEIRRNAGRAGARRRYVSQERAEQVARGNWSAVTAGRVFADRCLWGGGPAGGEEGGGAARGSRHGGSGRGGGRRGVGCRGDRWAGGVERRRAGRARVG